MFDLASVTSVY